MPLYEYKCRKCGFTFEVLQKSGEGPLETCQACGGSLRKLLSSPAIQFKGSGWYVTDYASKNSLAKAEKPAGGEAKPDSKDTTSSQK
jgi:putative FmdB family regulatory protein